MADRTDVVLMASANELTVGRQIASYVYGSFSVQFPDGVSQDTGDDRIQDGFIYRPDNAPTGLFDVEFVRADLRLDLTAESSQTEQTLDAAVKRLEGDVFFESDITGDGLGAFQPGVDFDVGDLVRVDVWGRRLSLPVTAVDAVASSSVGPRGWRVHVGGQMISDVRTLSEQNANVWERIRQERRERLRQVGAVDTKASTAQSTADGAKQTAIDSLAQQQADFQAFQAERDAQQDAVLEALRAVQKASIRPVQGWLFLKTASASTAENQYLRINHSSATSGTRSVEMLGSWTGKIIVTSSGTKKKSDSNLDTYYDAAAYMMEYPVPLADGTRVVPSSHSTEADGVRVDYEIAVGTQKSVNTTQGAQVPPSSTWTKRASHSFTAGKAITGAMGYFRVTWAKATFWGTFGIRVLVNGVVLNQTVVDHLGPLFGAGQRTQQVSFSGLDMAQGDVMTFEVYCTQVDSDISDSVASISWIE